LSECVVNVRAEVMVVAKVTFCSHYFRNLICCTRQERSRVSCYSRYLQLVTWMQMRREFQVKDPV